MDKRLRAMPLARTSFGAFGDVVETGTRETLINAGLARAFDGLANIDVAAQGGRARVRIFRVSAQALPFQVSMLERHPLSSQLFMPLEARPFLVVVAPPGPRVQPAEIRAFVTDGQQGVNYRPGVWHHPVIALDSETDFFVVDREGPGPNCDETSLAQSLTIIL